MRLVYRKLGGLTEVEPFPGHPRKNSPHRQRRRGNMCDAKFNPILTPKVDAKSTPRSDDTKSSLKLG